MAPATVQQKKAAPPSRRQAVVPPAPSGPAQRRNIRRITAGEPSVPRDIYELQRPADGGVTLLFHPRDVQGWTDRLAESFGRYVAHVFPGATREEALECARALGVYWVVELPADVDRLPYVPVIIQGSLHAGVIAWFRNRRPDLAPQEPAAGSYPLTILPPAGGRPGPEKTIAAMSITEKLLEAMLRAIGLLPGEVGERLKELLTPEALATMAAFTTAYVVSQITPVGWIADIIVGGLVAATVLMLGSEAIEVVKLLIGFSQKAAGATTEADLDQAAQLLAAAVSKVGVDIILAILFHKAGKAANLKPPGPRSPGLVEVLETGGGKVKALITDPPATADLVTSTGQVVRVPVGEVPGNVLLMESRGAGGGKGGPRGGGRGAAAGSAPEPAPAETPAKLPGKSLAAADALAKKKPLPPGELLEQAKKAAAGEEPAPAIEKVEPPAPVDPKAAAKSRLLSQIAKAKERKTQIYSDIEEAVQRGKQRLSTEDRAELKGEKADLAREIGQVSLEEAKLQKLLADLEISPYERARAYSFSDAAARDVISRARGLDEMSGKPIGEPSIDHIVPVEEIAGFEGFDRLYPDDAQAVLSRLDNLRLMEKALNSSKGSKRWANWENGRRAYGEAVWKAMVELEGQLRRLIQDDIKARAAKRHR
jgi:hypothetical protein